MSHEAALTVDAKREAHARLAITAETMGKPHLSFLAEVLCVLGRHRGAADAGRRALRLLEEMWGTHYANRRNVNVALNDVGIWLEKRLAITPPPTAAQLEYEVAWLRRLAHYRDKMPPDIDGERAYKKLFGSPAPNRQMPWGGRGAPRGQRPQATPIPVVSRAPMVPAPPRVEPPPVTEDAKVERKKNDGSLRAALADNQVAEARDKAANALIENLPPLLNERLRKGQSIKLRVTWKAHGNGKEIVRLEPIA